MSIAVPPPGGPSPRPDLRALRGGLAQPAAPFSLPSPSPAASPAEVPDVVRADMEAAERRYEDLQRQHRELHFRTDSANRVVVDVCDLDGNVLRTIPPEQALDVITGADLA